MNIKRLLYILLFLLPFFGGCFTFQQNAKQQVNNSKSNASDFSALYNPGSSIVNPQMTAFVSSAAEADVFFRIRTQELRNALANPLEEEINVYLRYFLRDASNFHLADTASLRYTFEVTKGEYVYGHFKVALGERIRYKLVVDFANSRYNIKKRLLCDIKNNPGFNDDKYIVKNLSDEVLFTNVVAVGQDVRVLGGFGTEPTVNVEFYREKKYVAIPPYLGSPVNAANIPDSVFSYTFGEKLHLSEPGLYAFGSTAKNEKFGLVVTGNTSYPSVTKVADMLEPMKLLCTEREFAVMDTSKALKPSIDAFWLGLSKSEKNAKEQIRVFYSRVALANMLFPSSVEGWKTDRGMIYIMLGQPTVVNITPNSEEWMYGSGEQGMMFTFENNSGIRNDFSLLRSNAYQSIWQQVTATWQSGKIFTVSKLNDE